MSLYQVEGLGVGVVDRSLVHDVSFALEPGECVALIGESGSGKTLTGFAPFGLVDGVRLTGSVRLSGQELIGTTEVKLRETRARDVGFAFQQPLTALTAHRTVAQHLVESGAAHDRQVLRALLADVGLMGDGLADVLRRYPHQLSGGQRQRVMIACAIARAPKLLIADEPTSALDAESRAGVRALLRRLRKTRNLGVLLVSHDLAEVAQDADQVVVLHQGRAVETGPTRDVIARPQSVYARALLGVGGAESALPIRREGGTAKLRRERRNTHTPLLSAHDLHVSYRQPGWRGHRLKAVDHVSLEITQGEAVALVGASGSGKSTLARAIARLGPCDSGKVLWRGELLPPRHKLRTSQRQHIQPVFQDPVASLDPRWRVCDVVAEPLRAFAPDLTTAERDARVLAALEAVELGPDYTERRPQTLSGGQAQRVALARALVSNPEMLMLDEATSALDALTARAIVALFMRLRTERGLAILMITHDEPLARSLCNRIIRLEAGRIISTDS
ncbi:MAG: ABC transporter ATP-binding protein [Alphaproteobacteria bacterium]|nr:ABC transporter ATP-binding protein [Alphaproteobacteria bacterium]MDE2042083.1 ABC transporter ATP-binding protein [Alphaproteobacteria bacterium]MDE2340942.1 ABC transporter ATP-binding protein [Alphaproteobacteria bacterium]